MCDHNRASPSRRRESSFFPPKKSSATGSSTYRAITRPPRSSRRAVSALRFVAVGGFDLPACGRDRGAARVRGHDSAVSSSQRCEHQRGLLVGCCSRKRLGLSRWLMPLSVWGIRPRSPTRAHAPLDRQRFPSEREKNRPPPSPGSRATLAVAGRATGEATAASASPLRSS